MTGDAAPDGLINALPSGLGSLGLAILVSIGSGVGGTGFRTVRRRTWPRRWARSAASTRAAVSGVRRTEEIWAAARREVRRRAADEEQRTRSTEMTHRPTMFEDRLAENGLKPEDLAEHAPRPGSPPASRREKEREAIARWKSRFDGGFGEPK